jgi:diphthine methyl ester acylhydrolase
VTYPSAVLDLHFSLHAPNLLGVASSSGSISLFKLQETPSYALIHLHTYQNFPASTLVLSLAWHPSCPDLIGVSLSTGSIALLQFSHDRSSLTALRDDMNLHDGLEAWTLAFSPTYHSKRRVIAQSIYSGGDDSRLRCITFMNLEDLSLSPHDLAKQSPGGSVGMIGHNAGITAILPLPIYTDAGQDILLTGSYDDHVRIYATYDHRLGHTNTPKVLAELRIGGGVWRLKFLQDYSYISQTRTTESQIMEVHICTFRVLASCMHAGARVLEVAGSKHGDWTIKELAAFEEHKSMNYGSDVQPKLEDVTKENDREALCVSTSFYDKLLCVWRFNCN